MSDDRPAVFAGTAVANHETEKDIHRAEDEGMPSVVQSGDCVDCHHPLERVPIYALYERRAGARGFRSATIYPKREPQPIAVFYGCTNPVCRKLYWQPPQPLPVARH